MSDIKKIIKNVLDDWSESQFNIASEPGRELLTDAIGDEVDKHVHQLIEDIICSQQIPRGDASDDQTLF